MKLQELLKVLGSELTQVMIPVKNSNCFEKKWFTDPADDLLSEETLPLDAEVDDVYSSVCCEVVCAPYVFPPDEDGDTKFDVEFSSEEMRIIEKLADVWIMSPPEVVLKIVKDYFKSIEEE